MIGKTFPRPKKLERREKILLHKLTIGGPRLCRFLLNFGNLNSGFFRDFFFNNLYLQELENEGLVEINGFLIKKSQEKH